MRTYWLRILLGALAVFAVGMIGRHVCPAGPGQGHRSGRPASGPLTIPLPFVPFQLDGNKLGMLERLVVNRDAPKKVSSVELEVKLDDSLLAQGLAGCRLAANLESDSSQAARRHQRPRQPDGRARLLLLRQERLGAGRRSARSPSQPGDVTVPLLRAGVAGRDPAERPLGRRRRRLVADVLAERAESLADRAEAMADSIAGGGSGQASVKSRSSAPIATRRFAARRRTAARGLAAAGASAHMADSLHAR